MCRLFGMHTGAPAKATFWLLTAPDSLAQQSRREADGFGIGLFDPDGRPVVDKAPIAAYEDVQYAAEARKLEGTPFVAHIRYASTGGDTLVNTHPFLQDDRLLAHNGVVEDLGLLEDRLRKLEVLDLVRGQTDSERVFALITGEARRNGGDLGAAISAALTWVAENLRLYAVNLIIATAADLWAVRYPETHPLYVLQSAGDEPHQGKHSVRISVESDDLARNHRPSVVIATEKMDDDPNWRLMDAGEVLRVHRDLEVERSFPLPAQPSHPLTLADLDEHAAQSQQPLRTAG